MANRSGDLYIQYLPGWIDDWAMKGGTTHGSAYAYDTHVPILFYGWGIKLITTFSLDLNGILQVTSREKNTWLVHSITIDNAISRFIGDKLGEARHRIDALFRDQEGEEGRPGASVGAAPVDDSRRLRVDAGALIGKAERLLASAGTEDAEDLVNGIEAVKDQLGGPDATLKTAMDALADLLYYLDA